MLKFKDKSFLSSFTTLTTGSIIAQAVALGCAPILTRLFTPEEIGAYAYLISFAAIFMGVINGKYDMAIVVENEKRKAYALLKLSFLIGGLLTLLGTLIFVGYSILLKNHFRWTDVLFILIVLLSYAIIDALTAYNNRKREYKVMASVNVIRSSCQNVGAALLGLFPIGKAGLLIPYVCGQYLGIIQQGKTLKEDWREIASIPNSEMKEVLVKYRRQPIYSAPAALANSFSYSSITIFLKTLFGDALVGFYSISVRLLGLPLALISGNASKVFFESAAVEYNNTGSFRSAFKKVALFQIALAVPMVLVMYYFAPPVCEFVFGSAWRVAGDYIRILAPMFGIRFVVTTLTPAMIIVNKQRLELVLQLMFVLSSIVCFILCRLFGYGIETYLRIINLFFSAVYLIYFGIIFSLSRKVRK